jgi:hypothetical protein
MSESKVRNTLDYLKKCQRYRSLGGQVSYTTDPTWLVNMAINRRAGWPDDPSHVRGSAMSVQGKYPAKASGDAWCHLRLRAQEINTPRLIVRERQLGEWRKLLVKRLPHRFYQEDL